MFQLTTKKNPKSSRKQAKNNKRIKLFNRKVLLDCKKNFPDLLN